MTLKEKKKIIYSLIMKIEISIKIKEIRRNHTNINSSIGELYT